MTATFLVVYGTPSDPEAFDRHYRDVHIPLTKTLPGLRSYTLARNPRTVRGEDSYLVATLEWGDLDALEAAFASPEGQASAEDMKTVSELCEVRSMFFEAADA